MADIQPMLHTTNVERLRDFYESLGFTQDLCEIQHDKIRWMSMKFQGTTIMLQLNERAEPRSGARDVELFFVCDEIAGIYATWKRRGIDVSEIETAYYGMKYMYVRDPDGRSVCFESLVKQ